MKQAIYPLFMFFILVGGLAHYYPKLGAMFESDQAFVYDKPIACDACGQMMWDGPQAHSCTDSSLEIN